VVAEASADVSGESDVVLIRARDGDDDVDEMHVTNNIDTKDIYVIIICEHKNET
jgi:hypothetical protein